MKKLSKLFFVLIGLFPIILNASTTREEVTYRFYEELEDNVHYEYNPENICKNELVDYNDFIYSDYIITNEKPEEKENRIIESYDGTLHISTDYINYVIIYNFKNILGKSSDIRKLELYDENDQILNYVIYDYRDFGPYPHNGVYTNEYPGSLKDDDISKSVITNYNSNIKLKLDRLVDLKGVKFKITYKKGDDGFEGINYYGEIDNYFQTMVYSMYSVKSEICDENNICVMTITAKDYPGFEPINISSKLYKYKDAMYKCYSLRRNYVPGYYTNLNGFTKDEEKYKIEIITDYEEDKNDLMNSVHALENNMNKVAISISNINEKYDEMKEINQNLIKEINSFTYKLQDKDETLESKMNQINSDNENILNYINLIKEEYLTKEEYIKYIEEIQTANADIYRILTTIENNDNNEQLISSINELYQNNNDMINAFLEKKELEEFKETEETSKDDYIAMKDVNVKEVKFDTFYSFLIIFGALSLMLSIILYIKSVKKSRMK